MSSRTRLIVMSISAPVIAFAIVGGFLSKVMAREDTYQHLKIFDDVVGLITSSYVEDVNVDRVMRGAMRGLAEGLDPDSAYLTPQQVKQVESGAAMAPAGVGLELTRQYYLRVIAARDGSPVRVIPMKNADASPVTYRLDGTEQLRVFDAIEDEGLELWAIYHSHTHSEAYPSETDIRLAFYPDARYLLLSLADRAAPVLRSFWIRDGEVTEEEAFAPA